jgi:hypothetical protein
MPWSCRTVIYVQENFNGAPSFYLYHPPDIPDARKGCLLPLPLPAQPAPAPGQAPPGPVQGTGALLVRYLREHPAVKQALAQHFRGEACPIYFYLDPPAAEDLPWETLHEVAQGFLDQRWPIGRLREPGGTKEDYVFAGPLKVLAVLSATGQDANTRISSVGEWGELAHVLGAPGLPFPVQVRALVCEDALLRFIKGLPGGWASADYATDKATLLREIATFKPHLLHFFCHGTAESPPRLIVGTRADWEGFQDGSIPLEVEDLRGSADPQHDVWLVTLNCCESAARAADGHRLGSALVAAGFPAVIGMRERIASNIANVFCGGLYRELLKLIGKAQPGQPAAEVEWGAALAHARGQLVTTVAPAQPWTQAAGSNREWTIPVFYTRPGEFRVLRVPGLNLQQKLELLGKLKQLQAEREKFVADPSVPGEVRAGILHEYDEEIASLKGKLA